MTEPWSPGPHVNDIDAARAKRQAAYDANAAACAELIARAKAEREADVGS